jgi:hypothetical protein
LVETGSRPPRSINAGATASRAAHTPYQHAAHQQRGALRRQHDDESARAITNRAHRVRAAPPLERIPKQHGAQAPLPEQEAEAAEHLKRGRMRVLDAMELGQPIRGVVTSAP